MRLKQFILNEASFSNSKLDKVVSLLLKTLGSRVGSQFSPFGGNGNNFERFKKSNGNKGIGMLYVLDDGKLVRFNWESNRSSSTITSIDIWKDMRSPEKAFKTLFIPDNFNIVQSVKSIAGFIKNPSAQISEAKYSAQRIADADKYGIPVDLSTAEFNAQLKAKWQELGEPVSVRARKNAGLRLDSPSAEQNTRTEELKSAQKNFDKKKYADPDIVFEDLDDLVNMVASGVQPSLMITGMAGIGKTFTVQKRLTKILGSKGDNWIMVKGKSSPMGLYMSLFLNRDKLIVFDDMDSIFSNKDTINIIKAAVDSYDEREISWISPTTQNLSGLDQYQLKMKFAEIEDAFTTGNPDAGKNELKLPSQFVFTGRVIFISNIHESKMDTAIKSRSFVIDITLRAEDVIRRMESILKEISPGTDMNVKMEVLRYLKEESASMGDRINLRTLINGIKCKLSGSSRWKHLMINYG